MKTFILFILLLITGLVVANYLFPEKRNKRFILPLIQKPLPNDTFSIQPAPSESVIGVVRSSEGNVMWESRTATQSAQLNANNIKQAEKVITGEKGSVSIEFPDIATITLQENSELSFIQTLPSEFVLIQPRGNVRYEISGSTPISVKSYHEVTRLIKGTSDINIDEESGTISIRTDNSTGQIAYNDLENRTTLIHIPENKTIIYNDEKREVEIEELE